MADNLTVFGTDYTGVTGIKATGTGNGTLTYIRPQGTRSISANGTGIDVAAYASVDVAVSGGGTYQAKTNIMPTTSSQTITPDAGYDALSSVQINAMPTMTLPASVSSTSSGTSKATIGRQTSTRYLNIPTGYNATAQYYTISAVADGTAGTPTVTKSTVSNHSISVTPSVTNTTGYITGGTKTGTAVSVSASELVSGNLALTQNTASTDCTNYATVSVAIPIVTYYTSTSTPTSSQGSNGDIWLVTS